MIQQVRLACAWSSNEGNTVRRLPALGAPTKNLPIVVDQCVVHLVVALGQLFKALASRFDIDAGINVFVKLKVVMQKIIIAKHRFADFLVLLQALVVSKKVALAICEPLVIGTKQEWR